MRTKTIMIVVTSALLITTPVLADSKPRAKGTPSKLLTDVTRCRDITASAERLACYDASVAALDTAEKQQDLVVVDRQQVREARKTLFGISLPDMSLFGGGPDIDQVETTVTDAQVASDGRWTIRMADGARWVQTDDFVIARKPKANDKVVIKRAALGSFRMSVGGQPGVKARRVN